MQDRLLMPFSAAPRLRFLLLNGSHEEDQSALQSLAGFFVTRKGAVDQRLAIDSAKLPRQKKHPKTRSLIHKGFFHFQDKFSAHSDDFEKPEHCILDFDLNRLGRCSR